MKVMTATLLMIVIVGILFISGCATGGSNSPPPAPSGGGCGVNTPLDLVGSLAQESASPGAC